MSARQSDFITEARNETRKIWEAYNNLKSMQLESTALDYNTNLVDGVGENEGITKAQVIAVVHTTTDALGVFLAAGHGSNLAKLL